MWLPTLLVKETKFFEKTWFLWFPLAGINAIKLSLGVQTFIFGSV
jgi:hypothetical protein